MANAEVMALLRDHGRTAFSFRALGDGSEHWFDRLEAPVPDTERGGGRARGACVAYTQLRDAWVAISNPLARPEAQTRVMQRFVRAGRDRGKRVCFFGVEGDVAVEGDLSWLKVGEQPVWNPQRWPHGHRTRVRGQLRRAWRNRIVTPRAVTAADLEHPRNPLRRGLDDLMAAWLDTRRMAPMGFLVRLDPYHLAHERRFFMAERDGEVVAALIAIPVYALGGWFFDAALRKPTAPNGALEVLFDFAMRTLAEEGCDHVTFGMCPLMGVSAPGLKWLRRGATPFYNFEGLHHFKAKLRPDAWQPLYLVHPRDEASSAALLDAARAFLPGGLPRFLWQTVTRRATPVFPGREQMLCRSTL